MSTGNLKIRILSYHHIPNNGAFLYALALETWLRNVFAPADVKTLDYRSLRLAAYEFLKWLKWMPGAPFFYARRGRMWERELQDHLNLDRDFPRLAGSERLQHLFASRYDALVVGMDVWCMINGTERPVFPNLYWLPEKLDIPKIAYGVSAYNSDRRLIEKFGGQIGEALDGFDVIGARDMFTYEMVQKYRQRKDGLVELIPDPTFILKRVPTRAAEKLAGLGVDLSRPTLGLLFYGDNRLSREIRKHYQHKGYQILALGMYNPAADINLGHVLTPLEWAETLGLMTFCISDRFHGTIFCLKNQTPFVCVEKERALPRQQSKVYDLLKTFNLEMCYHNPSDAGFDIRQFLALADEVESAWQPELSLGVPEKLESLRQAHEDFSAKMRAVLGK
jgi:polysaccharide pyruvyl transferase WcaK-like protein